MCCSGWQSIRPSGGRGTGTAGGQPKSRHFELCAVQLAALQCFADALNRVRHGGPRRNLQPELPCDVIDPRRVEWQSTRIDGRDQVLCALLCCSVGGLAAGQAGLEPVQGAFGQQVGTLLYADAKLCLASKLRLSCTFGAGRNLDLAPYLHLLMSTRSANAVAWHSG